LGREGPGEKRNDVTVAKFLSFLSFFAYPVLEVAPILRFISYRAISMGTLGRADVTSLVHSSCDRLHQS
jgi:hypothetical protein